MLTSKPRFPIRSVLGHGWLPSFLKRIYYRAKGYDIGRGVRFGFGSVVTGEDVQLGEGTTIGLFSMIRGRVIELGKRVQVGAFSMLDTPSLRIGDDTRINEHVFVGGLQTAESSLSVGRNSQIQQMTFINPAKPVSIGHDTSIGGHTLIFAHQSWLSVFDGYPVDFRPIEIGNNVGIAWRVFIGAGAKIGDGVMVGTNSVVNRAIPPNCLAVGSPAKPVAKAPYFPRSVSDGEKARILGDIVAEMVDFLEGYGAGCDASAQRVEVKWRRKRWMAKGEATGSIQVTTSPIGESDSWEFAEGENVFLSLYALPDSLRRDLSERGVLWLDLEQRKRADLSHDLGEEVVMYLRRHGVRFDRLGQPK